jgi:hypothetical protein
MGLLLTMSRETREQFPVAVWIRRGKGGVASTERVGAGRFRQSRRLTLARGPRPSRVTASRVPSDRWCGRRLIDERDPFGELGLLERRPHLLLRPDDFEAGIHP